tara:strand:+ start:1197 stop:1622 length:426 start_codon:yes stop_codon:yes gene_type:complete
MSIKSRKIASWRNQGLILTSKEEGNEIFDRYINSTHCEKCKKKYKSTLDRQMDHSHDLNQYGYFRNILCRSCNLKRCNIKPQNTSGYNCIHKIPCNFCKQGFRWVFRVHINEKIKSIKYSVDKEWLIEFAIKWKIDNNYDN